PSSTDTISTNQSNPSTSTFSCASHANSINITLGTDEAIADSGATAHFLLPNVTISNKRKATHPLNITLPDGEVIQSTHVGNLNLPGLGDAATLAHVVPGLAHSSLLSIKQLCDNGCHVLFTKQDCKVYRKAELMLVGKRHPATGLWVVPTNSHPISTKPTSSFPSHAAHNAYQTTSKAKLIQFLHQCAFSPPPSTWMPPSTSPPSPPPNYEDLFPPQEPNTINHIFCWAALADQIDGTTYTDLTGRFPTMSLENKQYIFVAYDYTTNAIIVRAITDRESSTIIKAFDDIFTYLAAKGFQPQFNVLDNEASHAITQYLCQQNIKWQFVPPNEHRVNAAERAIQTFKNHLIAGLCSTDRDFPSQLWDKLLPQAQDSLNMLRTSRIDPTKSAYEILEGPHDFNRNPWAPPGCRAILHEPATTRTSWGPRGTDAWYIGPAMHHYRSYEFYVPDTRSYHISASAKFFPSYCDLPTESPLEAAARTAAELLIELRQQHDPQDPTQPSRHQRAIKIINDIYQLNSQQALRVNTQTAPPPRAGPTLSSNPTTPRILRTTPRLHTRVTQHNTPGLTTVPTPPQRSPRLNPNIPNTSVKTAPTPPSQLPSPKLTRNTPVAPPRPVQPHPPTPGDNDHHVSSSPTPTFTDKDDDSVVIPVSSIPMNKHPLVHVQVPHFISQDALHAFACHASTTSTSNLFSPNGANQLPYHISNILLTQSSTPLPEKPLVSMKSSLMIPFSGTRGQPLSGKSSVPWPKETTKLVQLAPTLFSSWTTRIS
ncbi:hypothetical protein ACHAW6_013637, partial [Cyclotella cf. meneghiniana]